MLKVLVPLAATLLVGCMTAQKYTEHLERKWVGQHIDQVITIHGPPHSVADLSNGHKTYEWTQNSGSAAHVAVYGNTATANTYGKWCAVRMTTDQDKIIHTVAWQGNACFNPMAPAP